MYWETEQEITLLHLVLEALDSKVESSAADRIVSGLIEMGLIDMDKAPAAQEAWQDEWNGCDVPREFIAKHYRDADDYDEDE